MTIAVIVLSQLMGVVMMTLNRRALLQTHDHGVTRFHLYWSQCNSAFVFYRSDVGKMTEHQIFQDGNEALKYYDDRVSFFKQVVGSAE